MNKELIKENLANAFENFKAAISNHTDINKKRADGGWSVGEIGNHLIKSTGSDWGTTKKADRPYDQHAHAIKDLFLNFELKFPSQPILQPDSKVYAVGEIFTALDSNLHNINTLIDNDDLTDICTDIQLPVWGVLTKYEWLILIENHIIRHTKQVNDFDTLTDKKQAYAK